MFFATPPPQAGMVYTLFCRHAVTFTACLPRQAARGYHAINGACRDHSPAHHHTTALIIVAACSFSSNGHSLSSCTPRHGHFINRSSLPL